MPPYNLLFYHNLGISFNIYRIFLILIDKNMPDNISKAVRNMKKRTVFLIGALVIAIGFCITLYTIMAEKQRFTDAAYEKALGVLVSSAHTVENSLKETQTSDIDETSSTVSLACGRAIEALSQLPLADYDMLLLEAYFNRTADYVAYLADKGMTSDHQTGQLSQYASQITVELDDILLLLRNKKSSFRDVVTPTEKSSGFKLIRKELDDIGQQLSDAINTIESVPTLEYDGKYSQSEEVMVQTDEDIGEARALEIAGEGWQISGKSEGQTPCYILTNGDDTLWISRSDGKSVRLMNADCVCDGEAAADDIRQSAEAFLRDNGYELSPDAQMDIKGDRFFINDKDLTLSFCANCSRLLAFDAG